MILYATSQIKPSNLTALIKFKHEERLEQIKNNADEFELPDTLSSDLKWFKPCQLTDEIIMRFALLIGNEFPLFMEFLNRSIGKTLWMEI